mmetsp:Transcript_38123/g.75604  ORF Transcript_38123/g.75604 Transcript_38123/m.75604 type:complete len:271 (+) Transcript_38123:316-1128(+)
MLPTVLPLAVVAAAIGPRKDAISSLLVINVVSLIAPAIRPHTSSGSVHAVHMPLTLKPPAIAPGIYTVTINAIIVKFASIGGIIGPTEAACATLDPVLVLPDIVSSIGPVLRALPVLPVIYPLAFESSTIGLRVHALAMCSVPAPTSLKNISICLLETAKALGLVANELALVPGAIRPSLNAIAISILSEPLASVLHSVLEDVLGPCLTLGCGRSGALPCTIPSDGFVFAVAFVVLSVAQTRLCLDNADCITIVLAIAHTIAKRPIGHGK